MSSLPQDGLVAVVKRDCPTCELTAPVLGELARRAGIIVYTQDDPTFPETVPGPVHDIALDVSHQLKIEIVPTLIRLEAGREVARTYGWDRAEWERLTGVTGLGRDLVWSRIAPDGGSFASIVRYGRSRRSPSPSPAWPPACGRSSPSASNGWADGP